MDSETARLVLAGITALAVVVWLSALQFLIASKRARASSERLEAGQQAEGGLTGGTILSGMAEVEGQAESLADRAAALVARGTLFPGVPLKVVEKSSHHVRFERVEGAGSATEAGNWLRRGQLTFAARGTDRTSVEWAVELGDPRWLLRLGAAFLVAGLLAIVVVCWVLWTHVVPAFNPAIRWQTLQMFQVSHLLWPPFLFGALYRQSWKRVQAQMEALAHNLPYLENP